MSPPDIFSPALLIIDFQNDFCPPDGALAVPNGRDILPTVNKLLSLPSFIIRIATLDYHPTDHISFASNHKSPNDIPFASFATIINPLNSSESYRTRLWPVHCVQNTWGCELIDGLDVDKIDELVQKGTDPRVEMYSAFHDPFQNPRITDSGLETKLKEKGINWVYVVGLAMDYCVKASAIDAKNAGFEVVVVTDGARGVDAAAVVAAGEELRAKGVHVVSMDSEEVHWLK